MSYGVHISWDEVSKLVVLKTAVVEVVEEMFCDRWNEHNGLNEQSTYEVS